MKRWVLLVLCILLTSCSAPKEDYFLTPHTLQVTFEHGGIKTDGILHVSPEEISFCPVSPEGVVIRIGKEIGEISYNGMIFEGVTELSRLKDFWEQFKNNELDLTFGKSSYPEAIEGRNFKITVHKEINK